MANIYSYDFANSVRDVNEAFILAVAEQPAISSILTVSSEGFTNKKMEWLDDASKQATWTITGDYTAGDGAVLCADTTGLKAGMLVTFEHITTGVRSTLQAMVGTVTDNVSFLITVYGGTSDQNIASGSKILYVSTPIGEGSSHEVTDGFEPIARYNFSQIMKRDVTLTGTALATKMYGINKNLGDIVDYQVQRKLIDLGYEVAMATIGQPRVERTSSVKGTMGGWLRYLQQFGAVNSVNASNNPLTSIILNEGFEKVRSSGGIATTIVAHPVQAKKFSAMNQTNNNPVVVRSDTVAGNYVREFVSDFGDMGSIVYSYQMPKDQVAIIDSTKIRLRPMEGRGFVDAPAVADFDGIKRTILGEYSLEVKNVATDHSYIYGLTA